MDVSNAVEVSHLSKKFRIYHERNQQLKASVLRGRRARYEDFWAVQDVSFDVRRGEAFGIIGHNGSGKSTLLKCLAQILRPDSGTITVNGSVSALLELGAGFHPELSGRENVYLNGAILGLSRREIDRRFESIVDFAGLAQFIDTPVKNYSSGMYVRLGFAIAINVDPDILVIDEVLAVGDAAFQKKCADKIAEFRNRGKTIVLVSHGLGDVRSLCERCAWIDHGHLKSLGPAHQVVDEYSGASHEGRDVVVQDGTRWGSGEVQIVSVELLDDSQTSVRFARSGDPLIIRMHYSCSQPVSNAIFGFGLHDLNGVHVTGTNSRRHGRVIPVLDGQGYIDVYIARLALLEGTYELSVAINDWTEQRDIDFIQGAVRFDVLRGLVVEDGLVSLGCEWRLEGIQPDR